MPATDGRSAGTCFRHLPAGAVPIEESTPVDAVDRRILVELRNSGRLTVTELAGRIRLSVSPGHRRSRDLERSGVIRGCRAVVDRAAVGLGFGAAVFVTMRMQDRGTVARFEDAGRFDPRDDARGRGPDPAGRLTCARRSRY
jgi:hypothetical protein